MQGRLVALVVAFATLLSVGALASPASGSATTNGVRYVAPSGHDTRRPACPGGTKDAPWRTIEHGMRCMRPGMTLLVRGGTYVQRVLPVIVPGTKDLPIHVAAAPKETVLVKGLIRLDGADHWSIDRIHVTNDGKPYGPGEYLVKFRDGVGWRLSNSRIWGARSYAAVRVETGNPAVAEPANWWIVGNCIHSTAKTHPPYQDHNIYVSTGLKAGLGVIERNIIYGAPNGQNIKLGSGGGPAAGTANVLIRFNTMWGAVQNVLASGQTRNIVLERNIFGGTIRPKSWYPNVRGFGLKGKKNRVVKNLGQGKVGQQFIFNDLESAPGWVNLGGNRFPVAPKFDRLNSCEGFHPRAPIAQSYGRYGKVG